MIAEGNLIGRIGAVLQLVENTNGVNHAQDRIQLALRADDLIDHQRLDDRAGIGQTRGFNDDPVRRRLFRQNGPESPDQIAPNHAADAAATQLDEFLLAGFDQVTVDTDVTELVHDNRVTPPKGVRQKAVQQGRLSRAQKARHDGDGDPCVIGADLTGHGLFPRHQRDVNNLSATADRVDGVVRVFQAKLMGGDPPNIEAIGIELFQGELTALEVMAAGRFDGDVLVADFS